MTPRAVGAVACAAFLTAAALVVMGPAHAQTRLQQQRVVSPRSLTELREQDNRIDRMMRQGELRVRELRGDRQVAGGAIERAEQRYRGVRVFGAEVSRQMTRGQTMSAFGTLYENIDIDTVPRVAEAQARALIESRTGQRLGPGRGGELLILPLDAGGYALTWKLRVAMPGDVREFFVDARTGDVILEFSDLQTQLPPIGRGTGVNGDTKKISVLTGPGGFIAHDTSRPPSIRTYDMKGNPFRVDDVLNGFVTLNTSDFSADADNAWTDTAAVDAHVYSGWTYDYYFKRFGRRGLNDNNLMMRTMVHPVRRSDESLYFDLFPEFFTNAFYAGNGFMVYGVGLSPGTTAGGRSWNFMSGAFDIVAHEITHGVTEYTSDLIYRNESGALNESFSDIMGTSAEFFFQAPGNGLMQADYILAEDAVRAASSPLNGFRSMANPTMYGHPDHYSIRFLGTDDNGGVHINSSISNHAFYLAVEGGTHRLSGVAVSGVGSANREQMEHVFYRAFTSLLTPNATFSMARAATIQAARDLYGAGSAAEQAVTQAWTAVGVN
jgi:thermolysin